MIDMPPKHRDYVKGLDGNYHVFEVLPEACAGADWSSCTHAKFGTLENKVSQMEQTSQRSWTVGERFSAEVGNLFYSVRTSMEVTYGENFSKTQGTIDSFTFSKIVPASTGDTVIYHATPYKLWEYPVYALGSATQSIICS